MSGPSHLTREGDAALVRDALKFVVDYALDCAVYEDDAERWRFDLKERIATLTTALAERDAAIAVVEAGVCPRCYGQARRTLYQRGANAMEYAPCDHPYHAALDHLNTLQEESNGR